MPSAIKIFAAGLIICAATKIVESEPLVGSEIRVEPGGLQSALDQVVPGDTIILAPGEYYETVVTKIDGLPDAYITVKGESRDAVIKGDEGPETNRIFSVEHSYYKLDHFTIDGKQDDHSYVEKCLYVQANQDIAEVAQEIEFNGHSFRSSINGLIISGMNVRNCGGECIRLRYFITYAQVYNNIIENCGVHDFVLNKGVAKNGEGIYLGTSSNQWSDGKNPSNEPDVSKFNHIFDNHFNTQGNEGCDIKEGSVANILENNYCTGQLDESSACLDARGSRNIIRYNTIENNKGAAVRLGGHTIVRPNPETGEDEEETYGINNEVYHNLISNNEFAAVKVEVSPQGAMCLNVIEGTSEFVRGYAATGLQPDGEDCSVNVPIEADFDGGGGPEIDGIIVTPQSLTKKEHNRPTEINIVPNLKHTDFMPPTI